MKPVASETIGFMTHFNWNEKMEIMILQQIGQMGGTIMFFSLSPALSLSFVKQSAPL